MSFPRVAVHTGMPRALAPLDPLQVSAGVLRDLSWGALEFPI